MVQEMAPSHHLGNQNPIFMDSRSKKLKLKSECRSAKVILFPYLVVTVRLVGSEVDTSRIRTGAELTSVSIEPGLELFVS